MKTMEDILWLDSVDSTNNEARRRFDSLPDIGAIAASSQTSGRGQRGNIWSSQPGMNLTFSIVIKNLGHIRAAEQFALSQIASLTAVDFLSSYGITAKIKWPNDIYVGSSKICGILIENSLMGNRLRDSIIGVGLNVNQTEFDKCIPNPTSIAMCSGETYEPDSCLVTFMHIFKSYVSRYLNISGGLARIDKLYASQLWRKDEMNRFEDLTSGSPVVIDGIIRGVSPLGLLRVETEKGGLKEFAFRQIRYII